LRHVATQRLASAGLDLEVVAGAEHDRSEPVPLGLEGVTVTRRDRGGRLGQHRIQGRREGKVHPQTVPPDAAAGPGVAWSVDPRFRPLARRTGKFMPLWPTTP